MLAVCETGGSAWGYVVPILALALWGGIVFAIFRGSAPEDRPWLVALLFGCVLLGLLVLLGARAVGGDAYRFGFYVSLGLSAALGLATGLVRRRATLRSVGAAIAGYVFLPGLLALFIIWLFVGTGFCLD